MARLERFELPTTWFEVTYSLAEFTAEPCASGFSSAPPLSGGVFLRGWKGQTVANLYQFARSEMPQGTPGSLTDQQYADIIAYMFNLSRLPAGENELPSDPQQLNMIIIEPVASKLSL